MSMLSLKKIWRISSSPLGYVNKWWRCCQNCNNFYHLSFDTSLWIRGGRVTWLNSTMPWILIESSHVYQTHYGEKADLRGRRRNGHGDKTGVWRWCACTCASTCTHASTYARARKLRSRPIDNILSPIGYLVFHLEPQTNHTVICVSALVDQSRYRHATPLTIQSHEEEVSAIVSCSHWR